jgi:hypothetical protein
MTDYTRRYLMKQLLIRGVMLAWVVVVGSGLAQTEPAWSFATLSNVTQAEMNVGDEPLPEMRASIVDREGDQFIAKTEEGHEFRLPVQGAPPDIQIGDALRLVPNPETQTMNVFKADPPDGSGREKSQAQL